MDKLSSQKSLDTVLEKVRFTRVQIEWLERQFPEFIGSVDTTIEEFQRRAGTRTVLDAIRRKVEV